MPAQKPIVCFVTPTSASAKSVKAFGTLIDDLQETKIDFKVFGASGHNTKAQLDQQVVDAWNFVVSKLGPPRPPPATPYDVPVVFVAGGTSAASALASNVNTGTYPIVQAAGGSKLSLPNMTGFYLNAPGALTICQQQYNRLMTTADAPAAVLYDSMNDPGGTILSSLTTYAAAKTLNIWDIAGNMGNLTVYNLQTVHLRPPNVGNKPSTSFMLIPNAVFYDQSDAIATVVEGAGLQNAIYPEREYKNAHSNKTGKQVLGHKIGLTFALAAYYVDSLLNGVTLPSPTLPWQEAITDP